MCSGREADTRVASVRPGPRRGRQTITLDDGRTIVLSDETCVRAAVRAGAIADEAYLATLEAAEQRATAHEAALRLLSYRARSEREVRTRLARNGIGPDVIEEEVSRLREVGLLDDAAFARMWVEERGQLAPRGTRLLRNELRAKGIASPSIAEATKAVDDEAAALVLARERGARIGPVTYAEFRRRVGGFLQRKGFDHEAASAALRKVWAEGRGEAAEGDD